MVTHDTHANKTASHNIVNFILISSHYAWDILISNSTYVTTLQFNCPMTEIAQAMVNTKICKISIAESYCPIK